jgi:arabinan endo-1,5-alpha-L-arabinosidase
MVQRSRFAILFLILAGLVSPVLALTGDIAPVHDPSIIESDGTFYVFCTGRGLPIRASKDLFHWRRIGTVFPVPQRRFGVATTTTAAPAGVPAWTAAYSGGSTSFWAPDISFFHGRFHIYYAVSTFGSSHSAIGLVTNPTLNPNQPAYKWTDGGKVVESHDRDNSNAIDPAVFVADAEHVWLVYGSCWSGIKLVLINPDTGQIANPAAPPVALAYRPNGQPLEEGYLTHRGEWYFLWASFDHCCRGIRSDYNIRIGRSRNIAGPYVDRDGTPMLRGGGSVVLESSGDVRGPGSSAVLSIAGQDYLIHHFYDGQRQGVPTLAVHRLTWNTGDWPMAGEPISGPVAPQ